MTSPGEDPCRLAAHLELKESKKMPFDPSLNTVLDKMLLDVYAMVHPKPSDYEERSFIVKAFDKMAKDIFGNNRNFPNVEVLGSFTMDLFTSTSDLDLSINFSDGMTEIPRDQKISVLRKLTRVLRSRQRRGSFTDVAPIMRAKVPIVKAVDCRTGVECDFSVENKDGILKSLFYKAISSIDERFQKLSLLMKVWAKSHGINSSKDQTMNSLTIISLVALHLQTRSPPILPPFSAILKDGNDISAIQKNAMEFKEFGKRNRQSVAELFVSLFFKLSSAEDYWEDGLCASTYEGLWINKTWRTGVGNMSVEDFLDRSENFARAVGKNQVPKIYSCIRESINYLSDFMKGQLDTSRLRDLLFKSIDAKSPYKPHVHSERENSHERKRNIFDNSANSPRATQRARHDAHYNHPTSFQSVPSNNPMMAQPIIPMYGLKPPVFSPSQPRMAYSKGTSYVPLNMPMDFTRDPGFSCVPHHPIAHRFNVPQYHGPPYASHSHYPVAYPPFPSDSSYRHHAYPPFRSNSSYRHRALPRRHY